MYTWFGSISTTSIHIKHSFNQLKTSACVQKAFWKSFPVLEFNIEINKKIPAQSKLDGNDL